MTGTGWDAIDLEACGERRYRTVIGPEWVLARVPHGGIVAAVAAKAMAEALGTDQPLRAIHGVFASPVAAGPVTVEVEVLRTGRAASQAQATVTGEGSATVGYRALAVFASDRPGFAFTELVPPVVPDPADCPAFRDPPPPESGIEDWDGPWPMWRDVLEGRAALGHPPWDPTPRGAAEVAHWFRCEDPPLHADGSLDPLALLVFADMMPGSVFERIGAETFARGERWFSPSLDLSVQVLAPATPGWILAHAKAHHAGDGYASAEMALWDPRGEHGPRLVAWGCQQFLFTHID